MRPRSALVVALGGAAPGCALFDGLAAGEDEACQEPGMTCVTSNDCCTNHCISDGAGGGLCGLLEHPGDGVFVLGPEAAIPCDAATVFPSELQVRTSASGSIELAAESITGSGFVSSSFVELELRCAPDFSTIGFIQADQTGPDFYEGTYDFSRGGASVGTAAVSRLR